MNPSPVIDLRDLSKSYGAVQALSNVDLSISPGEMFGFLGPNGAGKTTTIKILLGFLKPTAGSVRIFGTDPWGGPADVRRRIGFLPDVPGLYQGMTGAALLDYLGRLQTNGSPSRRSELSDRLELSQADLRRQIKGYSHGMKQKLAIVQAMEHDPELLIMDEPTQGLDPLSQQAFFLLLKEAQARGNTAFLSSHILLEVEQLCQRVGIIRQGRLVALEKVRELQRRKVRSMTVEFAGTPPADLRLPGVETLAREGRRWTLAVRGDINPLLRELGRHEVDDLVFEQAHLEDIFLEYYRGTEEPE